MIKIGSSCALSIPMAIGKVVETRRLMDNSTKWQEVAKYCIKNKIYLIVTPCINNGDGSPNIPSWDNWRYIVEDTCQKLISYGGNPINCRLSIINEPMKFCTANEYVYLFRAALKIIHNYGFKCGGGNEEFVTAQAKGDMYKWLLIDGNPDILDIHVQGSCDTPAKTEYWLYTARSWTNKQIDVTEAFYGKDIATLSGWDLLQSQLYYAEKIGCSIFCNVFNNLDTSVFRLDTSKWNKLCFNINGACRSSYWNEWLRIIEEKAPLIQGDDDVKFDAIYKKGSRGVIVKFIQDCCNEFLINEIDDPIAVDGIFGAETERVVKELQDNFRLKPDGLCGKNTMEVLCYNFPECLGKLIYRWGIGER